MADHSNIEWCDTTWNPIAGCTRVGPDCQHCYAERMAHRLQAMGVEGYAGTVDKNHRWTGRVNNIESAIEKPYHWRKPRRIFVNSMSDFFHESVPDEIRHRLVKVMGHCGQHQFIILTKRSAGLKGFLNSLESVPKNTVWGVSICNQETAERLWNLLEVKHRITRAVSYEPALGEWDPKPWIEKLDWIIAGGESGWAARPDNPAWYRQIRDYCVRYSVPFFFKQWSSAGYNRMPRNGLLDGLEWNQFPHKG